MLSLGTPQSRRGAAGGSEDARALRGAARSRTPRRRLEADEERDGAGPLCVGAREAADRRWRSRASRSGISRVRSEWGPRRRIRVIVAVLVVPGIGAASRSRSADGRSRRPGARRAGAGQHAVRRPLHVRAAADTAPAFGRCGNWIGDGGMPWSHDYPDGEVHFSKILEELSLPEHPRRRLEHPRRSTTRSCSTIRSPTWRNRDTGA